MVTRLPVPLLLLVLLMVATGAWTEDPDYFYRLDEHGNPVFTQVLSWEPVEHVRCYGLEVKNAAGELVHSRTSTEAHQELQLAPGEYRYRVVLYNLLDQPELATDWFSVSIRRAVNPQVHRVDPAVIYLEDNRFLLHVLGRGLHEDAEYVLLDATNENTVYRLELRQLLEEGVELDVPARIDTGEFLVQVTNPGGLSAVSFQPVQVRYQKPVDLAVLVGWTPLLPLMDAWVVEIWDDPWYPTATGLQVDAIMLKRWYGFMGAGLNVTLAGLTGGESQARVATRLVKVDLQLVYTYHFAERLSVTTRAGAGVAYTAVQMEYSGGVTGEPFETLDPGYSIDLSAGFTPLPRLIVGPLLRVHGILHRNQHALYLSPGAYAGWVY